MELSEQIKNKSQEFRNVLSNYRDRGIRETGNIGNCSFIKTTNKVNFKPKGEGKFRIGKITDDLNKRFLSVRLDLPKEEFTDEFLMKSTGFSTIIPRKQRANFTCLKIHRANWDQSVFDTIDIKLYEDDIAAYMFNARAFLDLLIARATGEMIDIPNN